MYVCSCQAITDGEIREAVASGQVQTLHDLRMQLGVATRCGRCKPCAKELLAECNRECGRKCREGKVLGRRTHTRRRAEQ